jgi:hypothetical protein
VLAGASLIGRLRAVNFASRRDSYSDVIPRLSRMVLKFGRLTAETLGRGLWSRFLPHVVYVWGEALAFPCSCVPGGTSRAEGPSLTAWDVERLAIRGINFAQLYDGTLPNVVGVELNAGLARDRRLENRLTFGKWKARNVPTVEMQEIESVIDESHFALAVGAWV